MKIAFVNDRVERVGVTYLSAALKKEGHEVKLLTDHQLFNDVYVHIDKLDTYFDIKDSIVDELSAYQPDLIGFSVETENYRWACSFAKLIKQTIKTPIIFGGVHPTIVPEKVIAQEFVDIVCMGEGEWPIVELAKSMSNGGIDYSIQNLCFKLNGKIIKNDLRPLMDVDSLPWADHDLYYSNARYFQKGFTMITSRGCPYACSYCCHSYLRKSYKGKYFRQRSAGDVIAELQHNLNKYNTEYIIFYDDCFGYDLDWMKEFSDLYSKKIKKRFLCSTHPDVVTSEYITYLKTAGCQCVNLGIESWDDEVRRQWFNRSLSKDVMRNAIKLIKKEKIELVCDTIFEFPIQNEEAFINSLLYYAEVKPDRIAFNQLKYYPTAPITEKATKQGIVSAERYENVMRASDQKGVCLDSIINKTDSKHFTQLKAFLFILDVFPSKVTKYLIKKRTYRRFPNFLNPAVLMLLKIMLARDLDAKFLKHRIFTRYGYYIGHLLWLKLKSIFKGVKLC